MENFHPSEGAADYEGRTGHNAKIHSIIFGIILVIHEKVLPPMPFSILKSVHPEKVRMISTHYGVST